MSGWKYELSTHLLKFRPGAEFHIYSMSDEDITDIDCTQAKTVVQYNENRSEYNLAEIGSVAVLCSQSRVVDVKYSECARFVVGCVQAQVTTRRDVSNNLVVSVLLGYYSVSIVDKFHDCSIFRKSLLAWNKASFPRVNSTSRWIWFMLCISAHISHTSWRCRFCILG